MPDEELEYLAPWAGGSAAPSPPRGSGAFGGAVPPGGATGPVAAPGGAAGCPDGDVAPSRAEPGGFGVAFDMINSSFRQG